MLPLKSNFRQKFYPRARDAVLVLQEAGWTPVLLQANVQRRKSFAKTRVEPRNFQ